MVIDKLKLFKILGIITLTYLILWYVELNLYYFTFLLLFILLFLTYLPKIFVSLGPNISNKTSNSFNRLGSLLLIPLLCFLSYIIFFTCKKDYYTEFLLNFSDLTSVHIVYGYLFNNGYV